MPRPYLTPPRQQGKIGFMGGLITLTTDFGLADPYVGIMKGVVLRINPAARLVDLSHQVPQQDIRHGAYLIASSYAYFPPDVVHVVVVDPGVGSDRRGIAVRTEQGAFVAPDNGVLSLVLNREAVLEAVVLAEPAYWLSPISATFHGRDVFAPVAAHLTLGVPLAALGPPAANLATFPVSRPYRRSAGAILGEVVHVDRHGNLITNLPWHDEVFRPGPARVEIGGVVIQSVRHTFSSVEPGELVAYVGSGGTLEIGVRDGNASKALNVCVGDAVAVTRTG